MAAITSLIVKIKTSSTTNANTDDRIYFGVGTREWRLDNPNRNDFELGQTDTFDLQELAGLEREHIRQIQLRKEGTNGWKPESIQVFVNRPSATGRPFYSGSVDFFLDGGPGTEQKAGLLWEASDFPKPRYRISSANVSRLVVQVTTSSQADSDTDDQVYFGIGTREWLLDNLRRDDFERGQTDTFELENLNGLKVSDIREVNLRKAGTNGWRVERIRVWVNSGPGSGPAFFDGAADIFLDGGGGAENRHGLSWSSRDFPQPAPQPVENRVTALKLELETSNAQHSDTDDGIYFSIGTREWYLDNTSRDDFERGRTDTFVLSDLDAMGGLRLSDIRKVALRKTGSNGWRPKHIKVFVNNEAAPYYEGTVEIFLDGGSGTANKYGLYWEAADFYWEIPVHCHLVIGQTTSTIRPGRNKQASAELLTNLNTATYRQGQGSADTYWTQGRLRFRVLGFTNVPVADADAQIMPDSTSAQRTAMGNTARNFNRANRLNIYFVRQTVTGSNWFINRGTGSAACWVKDTRGGATVNTSNNFKRVAISTAHEIGHFFGLSHNGAQKFLMTGNGTNTLSQLIRRAEADTAFANAQSLAENA